MIYPPKITKEDLPLKSPSTIYPPPQIVQTHNIMLCFTKVFSAKDQLGVAEIHVVNIKFPPLEPLKFTLTCLSCSLSYLFRCAQRITS